jgi:hypothetical protein
MCIKNLIEKCGKKNVLKILPSLFIMVDTEKIEKNRLLSDNDYFVESQSTIDDLYKNLHTNNNYKKMVETVHDIAPILELFHEIAIDKAMVDSVVITYLGQNCVRYKNKSDKQFGKSLYLDVHAVRIALTDMQTEQTVRKYIGNGLKLCFGAFFFSVLHHHKFWNLHFFNTNVLRTLCIF